MVSSGSANLVIESPSPHLLGLRVLDVTGKLVQEVQLNLPIGQSLMPILAPDVSGMYLLVLSNEQGVVCLKWLVFN
ncbi:MAG: T9SS type A sorting domain-containing protein [Saprospiraceae bacterium]|nr:T9SS type A sorting domain-containing protein [Saprospiraceae bacterium]